MLIIKANQAEREPLIIKAANCNIKLSIIIKRQKNL